MPQISVLDIAPENYDAIDNGQKIVELQEGGNYQRADILLLRELKNGKHTGRKTTVIVIGVETARVGRNDNGIILKIKNLGGKK